MSAAKLLSDAEHSGSDAEDMQLIPADGESPLAEAGRADIKIKGMSCAACVGRIEGAQCFESQNWSAPEAVRYAGNTYGAPSFALQNLSAPAAGCWERLRRALYGA